MKVLIKPNIWKKQIKNHQQKGLKILQDIECYVK